MIGLDVHGYHHELTNENRRLFDAWMVRVGFEGQPITGIWIADESGSMLKVTQYSEPLRLDEARVHPVTETRMVRCLSRSRFICCHARLSRPESVRFPYVVRASLNVRTVTATVCAISSIRAPEVVMCHRCWSCPCQCVPTVPQWETSGTVALEAKVNRLRRIEAEVVAEAERYTRAAIEQQG